MTDAPHDHPPTLQSGTTLVIGGARSGKSAFAERLIESAGGGVYMATAEALDGEMADRIAGHQARRGDLWRSVEEPLEIAGALRAMADDGSAEPILIDCLTLWLSNLMQAERGIDRAIDELLSALADHLVPVVLVSNEVGGGIIPENKLARQFVDLAGHLNQRVAAAADQVYVVTVGIPQKLK